MPSDIRTRHLQSADGAAVARWMGRELPLPQSLGPLLPALLCDLIAAERLIGGCVEERALDGCAWMISGIGISGFVGDGIAAACLAEPVPHFALALLDRAARSPATIFLHPRQIGHDNANGGLNLLVLYYGQKFKDPADERCRRILSYGHRVFIRVHAGYNLRLLLQEDATAHEAVYESAGYKVMHRFPAGTSLRSGALGLAEGRSLVGLDAATARRVIPGATASFLFGCRQPELDLTDAQRRLIRLALDGLTDVELAASLDRSLNTLKQTWRSIYDRVERRAPFALSGPGDALPQGRRGTEKRRRLLTYMQDHIEELRPFSRRTAHG